MVEGKLRKAELALAVLVAQRGEFRRLLAETRLEESRPGRKAGD